MDCADPAVKMEFTLKAMLMWKIHNLSAYRLVSRCVTKSYKACPICGPVVLDPGRRRVRGTISRRSRALKKNVFMPDYKKWLRQDNTYHHLESVFEGGCNMVDRPSEVSVEDQLHWAHLRETFRR